MRFLDTSIPLEAMLPASKYFNRCKEIMEAIESGEESVITSPLTFVELYHILRKREKQISETIKIQLTALLSCAGLQVVDLDAGLTQQMIETAAKYEVDFVDAGNVSLMQKYEISDIYTLDPHYDKFKEIKRLTLLARR